MPLRVSVQKLNGEALGYVMSHHSTVLDLKQRLYESLDVKALQQVNVPRDRERFLDDAVGLLDAVAWFVFGDAMSSKAIKPIPIT